MKIVTVQEIRYQEQKISQMLNGRDYRDPDLSETLKDEIKWYHGLVMQYNAKAKTTASDLPYHDIFPEKPMSREQFLREFEAPRKATMALLCSVNGFQRYAGELVAHSIFSRNKRKTMTSTAEVLAAIDENAEENINTAKLIDNLSSDLLKPF
ncbi:TPA: hypothetical protein ACTXXA_003453 [Legionella anisa]